MGETPEKRAATPGCARFGVGGVGRLGGNTREG